jgi:hypothetical protein
VPLAMKKERNVVRLCMGMWRGGGGEAVGGRGGTVSKVNG